MQQFPSQARLLVPAAALCVCFAANAMAQSADCRGEGQYVGDLVGPLTFGVLTNPGSEGHFYIGIRGIMIEGESFNDGEEGWYSSYAGVFIDLGELDGGGHFSTVPEVSDWGHVITLEGTASDCAIAGTWTLDYDNDNSSCSGKACATRTGSFSLGGSAATEPMESGGSLCGTMSAASAAMFMATAVGLSARRRRRRVARA